MMEMKESKNTMLIHKAIEFAALKHHHAKRKGTEIPYIVHPFEVGLILQENGAAIETIVAGFLHDTLEDTDTTEEEILLEFGETVCKYVVGASEELEDRENTSWKERKQYTVDYLKKDVQIEIKQIACADKLSNIRSIAVDYDILKDSLWARFREGKDEQSWYYNELVKSLSELSGYKMYEELKECVYKVFPC